jgi:hypothetical protein
MPEDATRADIAWSIRLRTAAGSRPLGRYTGRFTGLIRCLDHVQRHAREWLSRRVEIARHIAVAPREHRAAAGYPLLADEAERAGADRLGARHHQVRGANAFGRDGACRAAHLAYVSAMRRLAAMLTALAALSACAAPQTGAPPTQPEVRPRVSVLDLDAVPLPSPEARPVYARFLTYPAPRAFAIGEAGGIAWTAGAPSTAVAVDRALAGCQRANRNRPCRLYARDQHVVWNGEPESDDPPPEGTGGPGWMLFVPPGTLHHGPSGRGAVLWTHGRGGEPASPQARMPQPFVQRFNNAGFDVWLLLREPRADRNYDRVRSFADETLREAARWLRAERGYNRVIAAGQSAGGWAALAALDTPGLLDGVIAIAGAGYYVSPDGRQDLLDFDALLARVRDADAPIVAVMFDGDPLLPNPAASAAAMRRALAWRNGSLLVIERPAGLTGHGAGATPAFNDRFGDCLLRLIAEGDRSACRSADTPT